MFNESVWTIKCKNCGKEVIYLKMYMEIVDGNNQLVLENFSKCPYCSTENSSLKNKLKHY